MNMYPPEIIEALKECLRTIYWYKRQLRSFLDNCGVPSEITIQQRWNDPQEYKAIIADKVVNSLVAHGERSIAPIRDLIFHVTEMKDFSHLLKEEEGRRLKKEAEMSVERLSQLVAQHNVKVREQDRIKEERKKASEKRAQTASRFGRLDVLKTQFCGLLTTTDAKARGT